MGRRRVAGMAVAGLGALGAGVLVAQPVTATQPQRSAWWNEAPLGLVVSPAPVAANQLAVGQETGTTTAVAALLYPLTSTQVPDPGSVAATLTVPYVSQSSVGTPAVDACPIARPSWGPGGDQRSSPPAFDCSGTKAVSGQLTSDSSAMVFKLGPAQLDQHAPGFDIALVPTGSIPFQAVFNIPGADGFVVQPPVTAPVSSSGAAGAPTATAGSGAGAATGGTAASAPPAGNPSPDLSSGSSFSGEAAPTAPPGGAASTPAAGAGGQGTGRPGPAVASAPAAHLGTGSSGPGLLHGRRLQLLGVWLLVDAGLVLYLFGSEQERAPRLLGSVAARRARAAPAEPAAGAATDEAAQGEVRGIGRFARARTAPPRRLF